jgi:uncharacterized membrane protein
MKKSESTSLLKKIAGNIWSLFLNGLFTILPLTITIAIFGFSFRLVKEWLYPVQRMLPTPIANIPHSEIILGILFILLVGTISKFFILRTLLHSVEGLIFKVPLIRPIYSGIKQLVHAFSPQDTMSFKKVVLIEFPRKNTYSIGFVTSEVPPQLSPEQTQPFYCVFVPTTPNPTTGYFIFLPVNEVKAIDLSRQEAMALIISGGIIQPERFTGMS